VNKALALSERPLRKTARSAKKEEEKMRSKFSTVRVCLVVFTLALCSAAIAQGGISGVQLSDYAGPHGPEDIEVLPGGSLTLYMHIDAWVPGTWWHVEYPPQLNFYIMTPVPPSEGSVTIQGWHVFVSQEYQASVWYPFCDILVEGTPSTGFVPTGILPITGEGMVLVSGPVIHITPEPSSILALGTGLFAFGGLLLRRRRQ